MTTGGYCDIYCGCGRYCGDIGAMDACLGVVARETSYCQGILG